MLDLAPVRSESMSSAGESVARADELHDAYLSELLSYSLERLNKEPELLRADADRVRRQMQEEAVGHYRAFITAAKAVQSIRQEITAVDQHLDTLIKDIPALMGGCNRFMEDAQVILEKRRLNRIVLNNHPTLLELLELPQLMDTCVRNGNYDEALDLEAFVAKLATMHAKLPVIQSLAEDVRRTTQTMLQQLLQRLRSKIQLPECLRVIGYLRRLAVFSEHDMRLQVHCTEVSRMAPRGSVKCLHVCLLLYGLSSLKLSFLCCREAWLASILADLDESNPYEFLKRTIDCHREQLFDVVTQYRAIFADDTSQQDEGLSLDGGLLYSWALHRISAYLAVLARTLPKIADGGSLASILEHCMYCGMSLGRVGLDFRGLLPPLFEKCVHSMFATNLAFAVDTFQRVLELYRWVALPALGSAGRSISAGSEDNQDDVAPPYALMEHPPLAAFVNGVLGALNQLRHCAPTALRGQLAEDLQEALQRVARALLRYHDTRVARDAETSLFLALCRSFVEVACPYCALCFGRCYPGGSALIDLGAVCKPMQRLVVASLTAPAEENGNSDGEEATQDEAGGRDIEQSTRGSGKEAAQSSAPEGEEGTEEKHASSLAEVGEVEVNILSLTHTSLIEQVLENGRTDGG